MSIEITLVTHDNANVLDNVAPDVFDHAIIPVQLAAFLDDPRHLLLVALNDGTVVGMATGVEYFHPDKPPQLFINEVGVTPKMQRQGIGRRLVTALLNAGKERGCSYAWVGTETDNEIAKACYAGVPGASEDDPFVLYEWELEKL